MLEIRSSEGGAAGATAGFDEIVEALADRPAAETEEGGGLRTALAERGEAVYVEMVRNLAGLQVEAAEARRIWREILEHKYLMSERLGRNVGVRVAAVDYLSNIRRLIARPRVVTPETLDLLYAEASIDPLTGLANRRRCREFLQAEFTRCRRYRAPFAVAVFDLDRFKAINDRLGHAAGDRAIRLVADALRAAARETDLPVRWGGEEFLVLMPETRKRGAMALSERLRSRVEREGAGIPLTVSGGLAAFPGDGETEDALLAFADRALYRAKAEGRNRICTAPVERRTAPRRCGAYPMLLVLGGIGGRSVARSCVDVGGGGFSYTDAEPPPASVEVRGEIDLDGDIARFVGRVSRVEARDERLYDVAVAFTEIASADREILTSRLQ